MTTAYATRGTATLAPEPAAVEAYAAGHYFTDGMNLYRIVAWLRRPVGPDLAEIEECRSLERILVRADDVGRLRLRAVHADSEGLIDA